MTSTVSEFRRDVDSAGRRGRRVDLLAAFDYQPLEKLVEHDFIVLKPEEIGHVGNVPHFFEQAP